MKTNVIKVQFGHLNSIVLDSLTQYDKGQVFEFVDTFKNGTEVQFDDGSVKVIIDGKVKVPDKLIEVAGMHKAWVQVIDSDNETTVKETRFMVDPRTKKDDYVEPEDEETFREEVQQMIEQGVSQERLESAIEEYFEIHPIPSGGITREECEQIVANYVEAHKSELKGDKGEQGIQGVAGKDGADGQDGYTPVKGIDYFDGTDGQDGQNYVITSNDYDAIANVVMTKLPQAESGEY